MAQSGSPPVSDDGLWFWNGTEWKSLVSADRQSHWNGSAWVPLPSSVSIYQPPSGPPATVALPSPPGYASPSAPPTGPPELAPAPPPPPQEPVEPRPSWLPADAPWPPASFAVTPASAPITSDATLPPPAPGAVPWANVYSDVMASAAGRGHAYAGFWIRFIAYFVDSLILGLPLLAVYYFLISSSVSSGTTVNVNQVGATSNAFNLVSLLLQFAYFVYFWSAGATPGMRIFGIRVADASTFESIGLGKAALRFVGFIVASFCCAVGLIWAAFDSRKQGWHDKIGGTVVLYR
jgi:uncharacterized RDD family membrane protein YckC